MHEIKAIMEELENAVKAEMQNGIECVNTDELGKVIDMIKDCSMSLYYYSIYKQMKNKEQYEKYGQQTMFQEQDVDISTMYESSAKKNDFNVAKRKYTEQNEVSKKMRMDKLLDFLDDVEHEIKETVVGMWPEEKQTLKNRINKWLAV
jgi:HrpA-like RNA helicase